MLLTANKDTRIQTENQLHYLQNIFKRVSVIIPAYNEEKGIRTTIEELLSFEELKTAQIIVVDDCSTDKTYEIVSQFPQITLIRHKKNQGYGGAIITGSKASQREYIVWYDADFQHRPEDLVKVTQCLVEKDLDYCIGVRGKDSHHEASRALGKSVLAFAIHLLIGKTSDFNSGLRGFKRSVFCKYIPLFPRRFEITAVTTVLMSEQGYLGEEVPIVVRKREGKSTVNQIRDGFSILGSLFNIIMLFRAMSFFCWVGVIAIIFGVSYGVYFNYMYRSGIPTLAAIIIIFGIQTIFFGIISDHTSKLRRENLDRSFNSRDD